MSKFFSTPWRFILGAMMATTLLSASAEEPGVVIMYADGSSFSHPISAVTRMEIGSEAVTMVHSEGSAVHNISDIDRIKIGELMSGLVKLPEGAEAAVWPTIVASSFNVLPASGTEVMVYDLNGQLVAGPLKAEKGVTLSVDASHLASGYYVVAFGGKTVKIVKQ